MADAARGDRSVDNRPVVYVAYPSLWLVNKAKVDPKTVQGILRPAKIQTKLDLYAQNDGDETRAAQGEYLTALGVATQMVQ
jgi:hypothetical protein